MKEEKSLKQILTEMAEQGIVDAIGDGVSIQGTDFHILYENKVHIDMIGDHVGKYCYEAYRERKEVCEGCPLHATFIDGKVHTTVRKVRLSDEDRFFEITSSPLKDSNGKIIAGIEIVRDITERKKIELELRDSEERYQKLSQSTFEGIIIHDKGKILEVNENFAKMHGYEYSELIGMNGFDLIAPQSRDTVKKYVSTKTETPYEATCIRKDGTEFPGELRGKHLQYKGRNVRVSTIKDISRQKKSEKELEQSSFYLDNVNDTIIVLNEKKEVTKVNKEFSLLWGYSPEEVIGEPVFPLFPDNEMEKHMTEMKQAVSSKEPGNFETVALTKSKKKVPLSIRGSAIFDEHGEIEGFIGVFRDITEYKRVEQELKDRVNELENFYNLAVNRELRMKELKQKVEQLEYELMQYRR
jgi:PAS domain S-box-containing protein